MSNFQPISPSSLSGDSYSISDESGPGSLSLWQSINNMRRPFQEMSHVRLSAAFTASSSDNASTGCRESLLWQDRITIFLSKFNIDPICTKWFWALHHEPVSSVRSNNFLTFAIGGHDRGPNILFDIYFSPWPRACAISENAAIIAISARGH